MGGIRSSVTLATGVVVLVAGLILVLLSDRVLSATLQGQLIDLATVEAEESISSWAETPLLLLLDDELVAPEVLPLLDGADADSLAELDALGLINGFDDSAAGLLDFLPEDVRSDLAEATAGGDEIITTIDELGFVWEVGDEGSTVVGHVAALGSSDGPAGPVVLASTLFAFFPEELLFDLDGATGAGGLFDGGGYVGADDWFDQGMLVEVPVATPFDTQFQVDLAALDGFAKFDELDEFDDFDEDDDGDEGDALDGNDDLDDEARAGELVAAFADAPIDVAAVIWVDLSDVDPLVGEIRSLLLILVPLIALGGAGLAWAVTGRALRPVRLMTERVDAIDAADLSQRVPEPRSDDEIGRLARTMNRMLGRVDTSSRAQRQFVADASHELRSPVAVLRHEAELALLYPERADAAQLAAVTRQEAGRLSDLVDDLLLLAAADAGSGTGGRAGSGRPMTTDLDDVVLAEAAKARRVPVGVAGVSAGRVEARSDHLRRIVVHLLDNAARHARERVEVTVSTEPDGRVVLQVDDDGAGVAPADRERIFERFVRLDEARARDDGGAGLGLAVVAAAVADSGAGITVDDSPLGGARFAVAWPAPVVVG